MSHLYLRKDIYGLDEIKVLCLRCGRGFWVPTPRKTDRTPVACAHTAPVETDQQTALGRDRR